MVNSQKAEVLNQEQQVEKEPTLTQQDLDTFSRLTVRDFKILKRFYFTGQQFPNDVAIYPISVLHTELKRLKIGYGIEGLRKRLALFVSLGLLDKVRTSVSFYIPVRDAGELKKKFKYFFKNFF